MTVGLVAVFFVAAALISAGALAAVWRREVTAALAGLPLMFAGAGVAFVGVARFAATGLHELVGQEMAILLAIASLALVSLGLGLAGRESSR